MTSDTSRKLVEALAESLEVPDSAYEAVSSRFARGEAGSAFGGIPEVGLSIEELLKRELKK